MGEIRFILDDATLPRTVFYDRLRAALARARWDGPAELCVPAEDTALETNWPAYGQGAGNWARGAMPDLDSFDAPFGRYLRRIAAFAVENPAATVLVVSKHPTLRLPALFRRAPNVIVADGNLATYERTLNPRNVSFPSLPMVADRPAPPAGPRPILLSFQGAPSHPVRAELATLHDGEAVVVRLLDPSSHVGTSADAGYAELLDASTFAAVPRGDALFSYRLLEVMARGAIPVILSDGWILPLDRTIDWPSCSLQLHQEWVGFLPRILRGFGPDEIAGLQAGVAAAYAAHLADLDRIVAAVLAEAAQLRN